MPQAYRLGEWDFYGLTLVVTPDVLIPRPDTEHLVDAALEYLTGRTWLNNPSGISRPSFAEGELPRVLDLCCGSGCVGLAIAKNARVRVTYADISEAALDVARRNGAEDTLVLDALRPPPPEILRRYDALVCNPPYIAEDGCDLDASVRSWEPHIALFAGPDGLDFYRSLLQNWLTVLKPGGLFAVETGYSQPDTVSQMSRDAGLLNVTIRKDYSGHGRIILGTAV